MNSARIAILLGRFNDARCAVAIQQYQEAQERNKATQQTAQAQYEDMQQRLAAQCRREFDTLFAEICRIGARDSKGDRGRARQIAEIFRAGEIDLEGVLESIAQRQNRSDARLVAHFWGMDGPKSRWQ